MTIKPPPLLSSNDEVAAEAAINTMKWTRPEFSRSKVDKAGKIIARRKQARIEERFACYDIAGNWRSSHAYPLQVLSMTLRNRARKIDPKALVAQRSKRLPSIISKLKRFSHMQLSQMQDLGGCRAVVGTIDQLDELVEVYKKSRLTAVKLYRIFDYVKSPKDSGYRSVHLVYEYNSTNIQRSIYNGLRIEIQLRSALQHSWATAVETIDAFTDQALKSGLGKKDWKRFFALMGSIFAEEEGRPLVPDTPILQEDRIHEVRQLCSDLNVVSTLGGLAVGIDVVQALDPAESYMLVLDSAAKTVKVQGFYDNTEAAEAYIKRERETIENPDIQVVLVSVDSISALKRAYPNYYLDTAAFVDYVEDLTAINAG